MKTVFSIFGNRKFMIQAFLLHFPIRQGKPIVHTRMPPNSPGSRSGAIIGLMRDRIWGERLRGHIIRARKVGLSASGSSNAGPTSRDYSGARDINGLIAVLWALSLDFTLKIC